jgi:hypothetical protein
MTRRALRNVRMARLTLAALVALPLAAACASSGRTSEGFRALEAVVVGRQFDPPGSGGASYAGRGNHYLVFEAKEGDATASYTFMVSETQYRRYQEGDRVQIVLVDNQLREIRPRS